MQRQLQLVFYSPQGYFIDHPDKWVLQNPTLTITTEQECDRNSQEKKIQEFSMEKIDGTCWKSRGEIKFPFILGADKKISVTMYQSDPVYVMKASFVLNSIVKQSFKKCYNLVFRDKRNYYSLSSYLTVTEYFESHEIGLYMNWSANKLLEKGWFFTKSKNSYLRFLKGISNNTFIEAKRTQTVKNSLAPNWEKTHVNLARIFDTSILLPFFKVQCWHQSEDEEDPELIGQGRVEYRDVMSKYKPQIKIIPMLSYPDKKFMGNLVVQDIQLENPKTFLQRFFSLDKRLGFSLTTARCLAGEVDLKKIKKFIKIEERIFQALEPFLHCYPQQKQKNKIVQKYGIRPTIANSQEFVKSRTSSLTTRNSQNRPNTQTSRNSEGCVSCPNESLCEKLKQNFTSELTKNFRIIEENIRNNPKQCLSELKMSSNYENQVQIIPFIHEIADKLDNPAIYETHHIVLIVTDNEFSDISDAIEEIADLHKCFVSFLFVSIVEGDFSEFQLFNSEHLQGRTDRNMTRYQHIPNKIPSDSKWIENLLSDIPEQFEKCCELHLRNADRQLEQNYSPSAQLID